MLMVEIIHPHLAALEVMSFCVCGDVEKRKCVLSLGLANKGSHIMFLGQDRRLNSTDSENLLEEMQEGTAGSWRVLCR